MNKALSKIPTMAERDLKEREDRIELARKSATGAMVAMCKELYEIWKMKLYLVAGHENFDAYCDKRWGFSRIRGYQLLECHKIIDSLPPDVKQCFTLRGLQEISQIDENSKSEVAEKAAEIAKEKGKPFADSGDVREAVKEVVPEKKKPTIQLDAKGDQVPDKVLPDWKRAEEVGNELRGLCQQIKNIVARGIADNDIIFAELNNSVLTDIDSLRYALGVVIPFKLCGTCQAHQRANCRRCKKRGWISKFLFNSTATEKEKLAVKK
jgi:hypothetical protein